eukprot:GHVU01008623.1.p1 GENE.GHVU01008623.1~~GHVU01008623.1.p1  ORF type:complete len:215 (-),score=3.31 GHVU01008623.1:1582-2226(-)
MTKCDEYVTKKHRNCRMQRAGDEQSPRDRFRINSFVAIVDLLCANLRMRLAAYKNVSERFGPLRTIHSMNDKELEAYAEKLSCYFDRDIDPDIATELKQFRHFLLRHHQAWPKKVPIERFMLNLILDWQFEAVYPNVVTLLRIYLSIMVANCTGERSFSKLLRVNGFMRSVMLDGRVSNLVRMSSECDILRQLDTDHIIREFASKTAARQRSLF